MSRLRISENEYQKIADLYISGLSIEKLEKIYNVSDSVIRRILKLCNVKTRDNSHKGRKYNINENYFDNIDTQNKAYILGLLYSDGCNSSNDNNIILELQEKDKDILDKINIELCNDKPLYFKNLNKKNNNWQNSYGILITNKHMSEQLKELGMVPRKSLILKFPEWLNEELIPHFLRGYIDGDGHIEWRKSKFINMASTLEFCQSVKDILFKYLNIESSSIYNTANKESNTRILTIFKKENIKKFLDYIYNDAILYIQRKYDIYKLICEEMDTNNSLLN